jgi:hypothetical protein
MCRKTRIYHTRIPNDTRQGFRRCLVFDPTVQFTLILFRSGLRFSRCGAIGFATTAAPQVLDDWVHL